MRIGRVRVVVPALLLLAWLPGARPAVAEPPEVAWRQLEPGLEYAVVPSPRRSPHVSDATIHLLRIDPHRFALELFNASADNGTRRTAREWAESEQLAAAINASLYQADYRTSTSLMRSRRHVNNPRLSKHNAVLLFDPLEPGLPPVELVDRTCRDLSDLQRRYAGAVQNIRMISCHGTNVWSQQPTAWSNAAIGVDTENRLLFVHMRAPLTTHDFADALLTLPIGLRQTMYVEGGPEAQLYIAAGGETIELSGSHGSSGFAGLAAAYALPIPNVLGLRRRVPAPAATAPAAD